MFFKILPISNTGISIAYILATVHFLYPKLGSFSDTEYYFYQLAHLLYFHSSTLCHLGAFQLYSFLLFSVNCAIKIFLFISLSYFSLLHLQIFVRHCLINFLFLKVSVFLNLQLHTWPNILILFL